MFDMVLMWLTCFVVLVFKFDRIDIIVHDVTLVKLRSDEIADGRVKQKGEEQGACDGELHKDSKLI